MALSDTDLHWIPMNRDKFNQLRKMFDAKEQGAKVPTVACDKCTSPRIRYSSAENVTALSQVRESDQPDQPDQCNHDTDQCNHDTDQCNHLTHHTDHDYEQTSSGCCLTLKVYLVNFGKGKFLYKPWGWGNNPFKDEFEFTGAAIDDIGRVVWRYW